MAVAAVQLASSLFDRAMHAFPFVFHPTTVLGVGLLLLIHYEWDHQGADRSALWVRAGAFLGSGVLALVPTVAFMLITGRGVVETTQGNAWQVDWLVGGGVVISASITWLLWIYFEWGALVPGMMEALVLAMVPYLALSPVWNISGHVIVALLPTMYLALVDRRFWPLTLVPLAMVPNRVYLDAHTWAQGVGGLLLAGVITVAVHRWQVAEDGGRSARPASQ
jgi:membrane-associated phospholipid phosphatase